MRSVRLSHDGLQNPTRIGIEDLVGLEGEDFGDLVGVELADGFGEGDFVWRGGFANEEEFGGRFELAFPPIVAFDGGEDIDAGGEAAFDEGLGEAAGVERGGDCGEDEAKIFSGDEFHLRFWGRVSIH
jgi:hypothetical protein